MNEDFTPSRRSLLWMAPVAGLALALPAAAWAQETAKEQVEVTPTEDLMREHGLLKRILLIYDEVRDRIADGCRVDVDPARQPGEQRHQRRREVQVGHQSTTATSTDEIDGR